MDKQFQNQTESTQAVVRMILNSFRIILMLVSMILLSVAVMKGSRQADILQNGKSVQGVVVDFKCDVTQSSFSTRNKSTYVFVTPRVRFQSEDDLREIEFSDTHLNMEIFPWLRLPSISKGSKVTVVYDPANPDQRAIIDYGWMNWIQTVSLAILGLAFFIFWQQMRQVTDQ